MQSSKRYLLKSKLLINQNSNMTNHDVTLKVIGTAEFKTWKGTATNMNIAVTKAMLSHGLSHSTAAVISVESTR